MECAAMRRAMNGARMHRAVIEHLCREPAGTAEKCILNIRCGDLGLLRSLRESLPHADVRGCHSAAAPQTEPRNLVCVDPVGAFQEFTERRFDCILSVSESEKIEEMQQLLENCSAHLNDGGLLVMSNINLVAIRDQIFNVLFSRIWRWSMHTSPKTPASKIISLGDLMRMLSEAGFRVREVRYMASGLGDWLWLPFALLTYPMQLLCIRLTRNPMAVWQKRRMYPFGSLLCSHYLVICDRSLDHASH